MLTNSLSNIAFKSNIKFVSHNQFRSKYANENRGDFDIVCTGDTKVGDNLTTQGIVYCLVGGITSNKCIMWHIVPYQDENFRSTKLLNIIEKKYNENNLAEGDPHCLLIGGGKAEGSCISLKKSINKIENLKINTKNNTSILWHSFYGQPSASAYNAKEDTWYIPICGLEDKKLKTQLKLVKEKYSDIFICEKDTVFIEDKKIERSFLNTDNSLKKTIKNILNDLKYTLFPFAYSENERYERWKVKEDSGEYNFYGEKLSDLSKDF